MKVKALFAKLLIFMALVAPIAMVPDEASAEGSALEWNIDGAFVSKGVSRTAQADQFINALNFLSPTFGMLNEVCYEQAVRIAAFTDYHLRSVTVFEGGAGRPDCGSSQFTRYSNAVLFPENLTYVGSDSWPFSSSPDSSKGRALICVKVAFIFSISTGCSSHASPYSSYSTANNSQMAETVFVGTVFGSDGVRTYLAGDYNTRSYRASLDAFYANYWETDPRSSKRWTTTSYGCGTFRTQDRGIDFIFGNKSGNANAGNSAVITSSGAFSDHCMVVRSFS